MNARNLPGFVRLVLAGTVIVLAAYWAGARYGQHEPLSVQAVRPNATTPGEPGATPKPGPASSEAKPTPTSLAQRDAILTDDEGINVKVYRAASPAVANILTKATEYDFFMDPVPVEGAGSGFVIDQRGYILTNFHVVQEAQSIEVVLGDQTRYPGKFIGADQRNDVALIKIDPKGKHITALPLGDSSQLQVGQKVLAIGNPFGFQSTLTTGVVSALGRTVQTSQTTLIDEAIQTDAAINRGNSGGPLINSHGEVIGINSAIYTPSGTTAGIGFAIPINTAKRIANDLINEGRVHLAFIGVQTIPVGGSLAQALELPVEEGLLVESAAKGGPAATAGVRGGDRVVMAGMQRIAIGGDVIVAIDGSKIANTMDLSVVLNRKRPGDTVTVTLYRSGKKMDIPVKLGERTDNQRQQ
ncbi:MAG: trypsin-like peptidase domain-containing protein [Acidobacteria bacterium]|nr:trypsin-like peptidase domain-containing protein [Acidobacteriota bacterium]